MRAPPSVDDAANAVRPADLAAVDHRVSDLASEVQMLRRQLSNLAWKLGEKLVPP